MLETFTLECPKCGKQSFVKRREDLYQCLACDHQKDLEAAESGSGGGSIFAVFMLAIVLVLVIAQMRSTEVCAPNDVQCQAQFRR